MALPNPSTVWKFVKYGIRAVEFVVPPGLAWLEAELAANEAVADPAWMRWVIRGTRATPAGTAEDKFQFKIDLVNITGGAIDTTWTGGDFTTVKNAMDTFVTAIKGQTTDDHTFTEYRAYLMRFNPDDQGPGHRTGPGAGAFADAGAPKYVTTFTTACTQSGKMPYQVAGSVTLRTAWPRHWGRFYLPSPGQTAITAGGRFTSAYTLAVNNAVHTLFGTLSDAEFLPVVPVTDLDKSAFHALLGVSQTSVDDIPDVVRRRRPRQVSTRNVQ